MRVLAVGNMYPPHHLGGYELVWQGAARHLRAAGHTVRVLVADHREPGVGAAEEESDVHRDLRWYWADHAFPRRSLRERVVLERHNAAVLERHLEELSPDVVSWWAMGGMSLGLIERVRRAGLPAAGFVHDDWMLYGPQVDAWMSWRGPRARAVAERVTGLPARVDLAGAARWMFVSAFIRDRALAAHPGLADVGIAHSGIDPALIAPAPEREWGWELLAVGRIDERKGLGVAVAALAHLPAAATLTVAGAGDAAYLARLTAEVGRLGLGGRVRFLGAVPRHELPALYAGHDALVFPVTWEEPWGLVPLEAMAAGRPVVASGTGGSAEYLRDGENALLSPPGDASALAAALTRLAADAGLRARLRPAGLETARVHTAPRFNVSVERTLAAVAGAGPG